MDKHPIGDVMDTTMTKLREMIDVNTVVGTPITTPDGITLIPVSKVSFGFASGGSDYPVKEKSGFGGGNGAGVKIDPIGFLCIKDNNVRMINIAPPAGTSVDRLIELVPEIMDRVEGFIEKRREEKKLEA